MPDPLQIKRHDGTVIATAQDGETLAQLASRFRAYLRGATLAWESHDLLAEILRQAAGDDVQRRSLAGLVLVSRDWCWDDFLGLDHPERDWALGVLAWYVQDGDNAPEEIRQRAARGEEVER